MDTVKTLTLIETTLGRRGSGTSKDSPNRVITQYWTPAGDLVAEIDPAAIPCTPEHLAEMREALTKYGNSEERAVKTWDAMMRALNSVKP